MQKNIGKLASFLPSDATPIPRPLLLFSMEYSNLNGTPVAIHYGISKVYRLAGTEYYFKTKKEYEPIDDTSLLYPYIESLSWISPRSAIIVSVNADLFYQNAEFNYKLLADVFLTSLDRLRRNQYSIFAKLETNVQDCFYKLVNYLPLLAVDKNIGSAYLLQRKNYYTFIVEYNRNIVIVKWNKIDHNSVRRIVNFCKSNGYENVKKILEKKYMIY